MSNPFGKSNARHQSELLLRELGINSLPVCPFLIADKLDIEVKQLPSNNKGVSGMLLRYDSQFGILYATYLENPGFERFSISHEIGHYSLPGHPDIILVDGIHQSRAGFISYDKYEMEADYFAANLLMPTFLFETALDKAGVGLDAIEKLAAQCNTSLTATAIRYAQHAPEAVAIIISTNDLIDYCFMSDTLKEFRGLDWLRKGAPVPGYTFTHNFNKKASNVSDGVRKDGDTNLQHWFGGDHEIEMLEEIIGLGSYGKTLTVLSTSDLPTIEDLDEEEALMESWTPRFKR
ncbi:MAG TPA: hypothetical protein DD412_04940 [Holosporales bacterium]|nr:hypothetical protein [Holosporales bacterium]